MDRCIWWVRNQCVTNGNILLFSFSKQKTLKTPGIVLAIYILGYIYIYIYIWRIFWTEENICWLCFKDLFNLKNNNFSSTMPLKHAQCYWVGNFVPCYWLRVKSRFCSTKKQGEKQRKKNKEHPFSFLNGFFFLKHVFFILCTHMLPYILFLSHTLKVNIMFYNIFFTIV